MAGKWLSEPHLFVGVDFFLGIASFCFQVAFLSTYVAVTSYDLAGTGIWAGTIFMATAVVLWTMEGKLDKFILGAGPCLSLICGVILFSLNVAALSELDKKCPVPIREGPLLIVEYYCTTEIALDVVLMLCGLFAIPVNGVLCYILLGTRNST